MTFQKQFATFLLLTLALSLPQGIRAENQTVLSELKKAAGKKDLPKVPEVPWQQIIDEFENDEERLGPEKFSNNYDSLLWNPDGSATIVHPKVSLLKQKFYLFQVHITNSQIFGMAIIMDSFHFLPDIQIILRKTESC